nr:hypothetical protein Iba_chr02fCG8180 [Ipomoea batatas]
MGAIGLLNKAPNDTILQDDLLGSLAGFPFIGTEGQEKKTRDSEVENLSMSSDDSQNNFVLDYNDQYDDEEVSESDGLSPGHSDDVQVVDARQVGGRPAKSRRIAPIQPISSKAPPKKKGKAYKGGGTSSRPKGKSTSKLNKTGDNDVELDTNGAHDTPTEITI